MTREAVIRVVRSCDFYLSIDPLPSIHELGEVQVDTDWTRLAINVTHYRGRMYLFMVDCGTGRFAIQREIQADTADIAGALNKIFLKHRPVEKVLMDNGTEFR